MKKHIILTTIILIITVAGCLYSLYWVLFSAWMTAYQQNDYHIWITNFYVWLIVFFVLVLTNVYGIYWIVAKIKRFKKSMQKTG